jgi:GIY-YIG catalytic domain
MLRNRITNQIYIGQTTKSDLAKRWNSKLTNNGNPHLKASIRKYGYWQFERSVSAYCSCRTELDLVERFFIQHYKSDDRRFGFNLADGGQLHFEHNRESSIRARHSREIWWEARPIQYRLAFGRKAKEWLEMTTEKRQRISASMKDKGKPTEQREAIAGGMKRSWNRRKQPQSVGVGPKYQSAKIIALNAKQTGNKPGLRGKVIPFNDPMKGLREIRSTRRTLREIARRLDAWELELRGGCSW